MPAKPTLPRLGIADKAFRYRPAVATDIRKTFARLKREADQAQRLATTGQQTLALELPDTVVALPARAGRGAA